MKHRHTIIAPVLVCLLTACSDEGIEVDPAPGAGGADAGADTSPGTGGEAGAAGQAGAGGEAGIERKDNRGDPSTFPAACTESCEDACESLAACGANESLYPLEQAECLDYCATAMQSPVGMWGDVSGNFRCCASQPECFDVATCGGWLKDPRPVASCDKFCDCVAQYMTVPAPPGDVQPPQGYRFAEHAVVLAGTSPLGNLKERSAELLVGGRYSVVRFNELADQAAVARVANGRRPLPTFHDAAGRIVAAVGDMFVTVKSPQAHKELTAWAKAHKLAPPVKVRYGRDLYRIDSNDAWKSLRAITSLKALPGVEAELDMVRPYTKNYTPTDPQFADQWHLRNTGKSGAIAGVDGRVAEAWDITKGSPDVIIAINDDGVDINHPDLAANCTAPLNFPSDWETQLSDPMEGFGNHGTSVAGVAAAIGDNNVGGAGVCPGCKIMPHMVGDAVGATLQMTDQDIANGFALMVDEGAWVISNSWGPGAGDPQFETSSFQIPPLPSVIKNAFVYAETEGRGGKGTVILFASGNENEPVAAYAAYETNLGVGAVDDQGLKSYYSNYGPKLDIAAPSNGGLNGITTTAVLGQYTDSFGGTSSACPFAAGVVGLIFSANPELTAAEARSVLMASATHIDPVWGGWQDGHSDFYGAGLVNAYRAVRMASGDCTDPLACPAPSDDCKANCDKGACETCRTTEECSDGFVCQAIPPLGTSLCVAPPTGAACEDGFTLYEGYCMPSRETCGLCTTEACNGRDEDCDGEPDNGLSCTGRVLQCPLAGEGCADNERCAGISCVESCETDEDCGDARSCEVVKNRYGASSNAVRGCAINVASSCKQGCQMLASTMTEADLQDFVTCMDDGKASCGKVMSCAQKLPIGN